MNKFSKTKTAIIFLTVFFGILFFTKSSLAATINAASCSYADVSAAITAASPEDTVSVPAGSCSWSSALTITKGVYLIGAGIGNTIITSNMASGPYACTAPLINYSPAAGYRAANYHFRVSGFTFSHLIPGTGATGGQAICLENNNTFPPQSNIRIDHNHFTTTNRYGGAVENWGCWGVIDNNIIDVPALSLRIGWGDGSGLPNWQNLSDFNFGSGEALYVEDNIFNTGVGQLTDADQGGRYVFRYNTVNIASGWSNTFDMHGGRGSLYGTMGAEVYGNKMVKTDANDLRLMGQRGGRLLAFYNDRVGGTVFNSVVYNNDGCPPGDDTLMKRQTLNSSYYFGNRKNETGALVVPVITYNYCPAYPIVEDAGAIPGGFWHDASPFTGATGVGCGTLAAMPTTCTTGVGYWATNQSCSDLTGMVGANPATPISGTLYKCTATDTWTAYYTPYTYPHPLRAEAADTTPPAAPTGITVN